MRPYRLTGRFVVDLPPVKAFRLFTPRGERDWVAGWHPRFPVEADDETAPGTVFQTEAHGEQTIWVVADRQEPRLVSYTQLTPGSRAGMVTVRLEDVDAASAVTVTYLLTPLTTAAGPGLDRFAANYPTFLASWQDAIEGWLRRTATT